MKRSEDLCVLLKMEWLCRRNIIGIGDTGVSTQNCFFSQGKVKDYIEISGQADSNGHGTHVRRLAPASELEVLVRSINICNVASPFLFGTRLRGSWPAMLTTSRV